MKGISIKDWFETLRSILVFMLLCVKYAVCFLFLILLLSLIIIEVHLSSIVLAQFKNWRSMKAFPRSQNGMRVSIRNLGILAQD